MDLVNQDSYFSSVCRKEKTKHFIKPRLRKTNAEFSFVAVSEISNFLGEDSEFT